MNESEKLPWDNQTYSVKRHGVTVANCESEPVQTPGCVQSHGALLALRLSNLTIIQASENSADVLGWPAESLLNQPVSTVIGEKGDVRLREFVANEPTERNPLYLFTLPGREALPPLDVTIHTVDGVVALEFEATGRTVEREPDLYELIKKSATRIQQAGSLYDFCDIAAEEVRATTGFDRVMVYKFHADGHGEVFAESRREDLPPWLGLHYPAEDIPAPVREIFKKTWIRPIPDVHGSLAELVPLANPDNGKPLTMTYCALRGASVMYTEYLKNMKVAAGLTMAIRRGDQLWGLIACHHYAGPKPIPFPIRVACEFFAQIVSLMHKAAEDRELLAYRLKIESVHQDLVAQAAHEGGLSAMTDRKPALLDGLSASGAALYHRERWWRVGETPDVAQLEQLLSWLANRPEFDSAATPLFVTDHLSREFPAAKEFTRVASGLIAFPLSRTHRNVMMWFRPETLRTVNWGGNPHEKPTVDGPNGPRLTPRRSFELFVESVRGRSLPWNPVEIDAAARLRVMVMELVVSRAERLAELNADLARSNEELDAFAYVASHDLKEPLRGIYKYAHQLSQELRSATDDDRRKLQALSRLTLRMDSLLDSLLHFSRVGRVTLEFERVDLNEVVQEAVEMASSRASDLRSIVKSPRPLPVVKCDRMQCREIFVNLLSNALKYNDKANKWIEVGYIAPAEADPHFQRPDAAARHVVYYVKDNGIGIERRHFEQVFQMFKRLHGRDDFGGGTGAGLTIVRKLVERHHGQVWIDSTMGVGSTIHFTLPCDDGDLE